jgi:hypothetical protein
MLKIVRKSMLNASAIATASFLMGVEPAHATNFNTIAGNILKSINNLPSFLSGISYMMGVLFGVLGVLKIKDHVENPSNAPLKNGAIQLAAGGALFALPIVYNAMSTTIGTGAGATTATVGAIGLGGLN